jgi:hypothetical protein
MFGASIFVANRSMFHLFNLRVKGVDEWNGRTIRPSNIVEWLCYTALSGRNPEKIKSAQ